MAAVLGKFAEHVLPDPPQRQRASAIAAEQIIVIQLRNRLPGEFNNVSVVGYDDDEPLARTSVPGLTTVALPHREIGEKAIKLLCRDLTGRSVPSRTRSSCWGGLWFFAAR